MTIGLSTGETRMQHESDAAPPFFFILSRPRTGSTLLRTMLDAHPNLLVPPECQFIPNLFPRYGKIREWGLVTVRMFVRDLLAQHLFETWHLCHEELEGLLLNGGPPRHYPDACRRVYLGYRSVFPKQSIHLIGDKNPGHALHGPLLARLFPEARFIHLVRDYRDNHVSLARAGFEIPWIGFTSAKWRHFFRVINTLEEEQPERFLRLWYEDLVGKPSLELSRICRFLGVEYHSGMLAYHKNAGELAKAYQGTAFDRLHRGLLRPVHRDGVRRWESSLTLFQTILVDCVTGREGDTAGYAKISKNWTWRVRALAGLGQSLAALNYLALAVVRRLPYRLRHTLAHRLSSTVENVWHKVFVRPRAGNEQDQDPR